MSKHPNTNRHRALKGAEFVKMVYRQMISGLRRKGSQWISNVASSCFIFYGRIRLPKKTFFPTIINVLQTVVVFSNFPLGANLECRPRRIFKAYKFRAVQSPFLPIKFCKLNVAFLECSLLHGGCPILAILSASSSTRNILVCRFLLWFLAPMRPKHACLSFSYRFSAMRRIWC